MSEKHNSTFQSMNQIKKEIESYLIIYGKIGGYEPQNIDENFAYNLKDLEKELECQRTFLKNVRKEYKTTIKWVDENYDKWIEIAIDNTIDNWDLSHGKFKTWCFYSRKHELRAREKTFKALKQVFSNYIFKETWNQDAKYIEKNLTPEKRKKFLSDYLFLTSNFKEYEKIKKKLEKLTSLKEEIFLITERKRQNKSNKGRKSKIVLHNVIKELVSIFNNSSNLKIDKSCDFVSDLLKEADICKKYILDNHYDYTKLKYTVETGESVRDIYYKK